MNVRRQHAEDGLLGFRHVADPKVLLPCLSQGTLRILVSYLAKF